MKKKQHSNNPVQPLLLFFCIFSLLACGGGGGSDAPPASPASLSYTGSTSKAVISASNAVEISSGAVSGGIKGNVFSGFASLNDSTDAIGTKRHSVFLTAIILQNAIFNLQTASPPGNANRAVHTEQDTIDGSCGGQAVGNLLVDDVSGDFSGSLTFSDYCDTNVTLNGDADFSGTINLSTEEFENLTVGFDYLEVTDASGSYIFDGTIGIVIQPSGLTISMDMYLQDDDGAICWIRNYQMTVVDYGSYLSMEIAGNFYDPDYGYVTLSTQQDLIVYDYDRAPSAGIVMVSGENGTQATLTCYPSGRFQVEADTDGDGLYDYDSGDLSWD